MKEICNIVGSRIRFIRRQKGYTLNDFADAIHRGKSTVSKYERGEISIDIETLADISRVLGVSLASLVDDSKSTGVEFIFRPGENEYAEHLERYYLYFYSAHVGKPYISYNAFSLVSTRQGFLERYQTMKKCTHIRVVILVMFGVLTLSLGCSQ